MGQSNQNCMLINITYSLKVPWSFLLSAAIIVTKWVSQFTSWINNVKLRKTIYVTIRLCFVFTKMRNSFVCQNLRTQIFEKFAFAHSAAQVMCSSAFKNTQSIWFSRTLHNAIQCVQHLSCMELKQLYVELKSLYQYCESYIECDKNVIIAVSPYVAVC